MRADTRRELETLALLFLLVVTALGCSDTDARGDAGQVDSGRVDVDCRTWAASLKGTGVPAVSGSTALQRTQLLDAGGGLGLVGNRYFTASFPPSYAASSKHRVLVALHGTAGSPEAEWNDYRASLEARGWGFLGLQYYDPATQQYDTDETIYAHLKDMIASARSGCGLGDASFFLTGFSRGSAKTFAMAWFDRHDQKLFQAYGSLSGGAWQQPSGCAWMNNGTCAFQPTGLIYPSSCAIVSPSAPCQCSPLTISTPPTTPNKPTFASTILSSGDSTAYAGARFWLYCGERDYTAGYSNCSDMELSRTFIVAFGGHVEALYRAGSADGCSSWTGTTCLVSPDTSCGHGSWKNVPAAEAAMWNYFESL